MMDSCFYAPPLNRVCLAFFWRSIMGRPRKQARTIATPGSICVSSGEKKVAATTSKHSIQLFTYSNLATGSSITAHTDVITGVQFGNKETDLLLSSSHDKTIKCWDLRSDLKKPVQEFEGYDETCNVFTSFDLSCDDRVICAGTEQKDSEAHLLFWDRRKTDILGTYNEAHQDDITQVCFHPDHHNNVCTGSTDGLVCVFDIMEESEEDALTLTLNSESSVYKIGWCGSGGNEIYCVTHIDTLHVWNTDGEGEDIKSLTDLKDKLQADSPVDYIVDCVYENERYFAVAGTHSGALKLVDVTDENPILVTELSGGHNSTVRVVHWDPKNQVMLSGGEDSFLCLWSAAGPKYQVVSTKGKMRTKKEGKKKNMPY